MTSTNTDRLLRRIEQRGQELGYPSRRQLSLAATGNPETLNNLKRGRMPRGDTLRKIATCLGVTPAWLLADQLPQNGNAGHDLAHSQMEISGSMVPALHQKWVPTPVRDLPAYATAPGGQAGVFMLYQKVAEFLERPRALDGASDAYAVYVCDDAMAPRYMTGELVYANPARPVTKGCFALVHLAGEAPTHCLIARVDEITPERVTLTQFQAESPATYDRERIARMDRIVMGGEG